MKEKIVQQKSKSTIKKKTPLYQKRIPVIYKGKPLTPCTIERSYHIVKECRGIFVKDKVFGWYLKLKKKNIRSKKIVKYSLGIDTGTLFTGFSVTSKKYNFNFELENTLKFLDTKHFIKKTSEKNMYKRNRRSRLRHRPIRNTNRIGNKISYTSNYYYQNIRNFVERICRYYPISYIVIEDVSFNHFIENHNYKKGKSFSNLEVNKYRLYEKLDSIAKLYISENNPKELRKYLPMKYRNRKKITDDMFIDFKIKNKSSKSFKAHCLDSFCLSCLPFGERYNFNSEFLYIRRRFPKIDTNKRKLEKLQTPKNNIKERRLSKLKKIRVKVDDLTKSNHLKSWKYTYTEQYETTSKEKRKYGTSFYFITRKDRGYYEGQNKYFIDSLGYVYYDILKIKSSEIFNNVSFNFGYQVQNNFKIRTLEQYKRNKQNLFSKI